MTDPKPQKFNMITPLGLMIQRPSKNQYCIDLDQITVLGDITSFVDDLVHEIADQCVWGLTDIMAQKRIDNDKLPGLAALGVFNICFYARLTVVDDFLQLKHVIHKRLCAILFALQMEKWQALLFTRPTRSAKSSTAHSSALMVPMDGNELTGLFFLIEAEPVSKFLRITLERASDNRLRLSRIPHSKLDAGNLPDGELDAMAMAKAVYSGILQQCRNQHTSYIGTDIEISLLLASLKKNGLPDLQALSVYWPEEMASDILLGDRNETIDILCKTLFMFNDREILRLLRTGCKVEFTAKSSSLFVDLSNRSRFLNLSYERPRQKPNMKDYLRRLPRACSFVRDHKKSLDTIHVFLVHHITSETLSLIQGSADMGSASIRALFVKYAGTTPAQYLEALAECSEEHYAFYALQPVSSPTRIDDFFVLSDQYSDIKPLAPLNKLLREKCLGFFDAMALVAGHLFFLQAARCRERGQKLVIVEDGGYIAPHLQSICLNKMKMFQVLQQFALPQDLIAKPQRTWTVQKWLNGVIIGSVEHTRNGYDALQEVLTQHNKLAFPSCSIAISDFKINQEAQEVAYSCINAIETILAGLGLVLTHRHAMILGSRGAIGSKMMRILSTRLASDQICGIDIKVKRKSMESTHGRVETHSIADLPKDYLYQTDLFIGVIGKSILNRAILEDMLFHSRRKRIIFVSGSTKTAEFTQLIDWLRELGASRSRLFKDRRLTFSIHPIKEPQFAYTQGRIVRFEWIKANGSGKTWREFLLLGGLQPINFLYYGVPSETMDRVMMELLATTAELVEKNRSGNALPPRLLALDHDIRL